MMYSPGSIASAGVSGISTFRAPLSLVARAAVVPDGAMSVASSERPGGAPALNSATTQNPAAGLPSAPRRHPATTSARSGRSRV